MADITEIIEESAIQLEIVESGGGQIEITDNGSTQVEIVETTLDSIDLDIAPKTNTLVIENTPDNANIDVLVQPSTIIETTTTTNVIEITENQVVFQTGDIIRNEKWNGILEGDAYINGSLTVSNTLFTDVLSASTAQLTGDGINDIFIINSGSNTPLIVNQEGLMVFDEFLYTPTAVEGGVLYSGSEFFIGLIDP